MVEPWLNHGLQNGTSVQPWYESMVSLARAWSTMDDWGAISQTMVDHGWWKLGQSMVNHGWWKLGQSMVNHGWWKAWPEHGQPWLTEVPFHKPWLTMVDKSLVRAWSTMADWSAISQTMVDHGQWNDGGMVKSTIVDHGQMYHCWPRSAMVPFFKSMVPMATMASQPGQVQVPSLIVENRYKVLLLTRNSFVQSGVQWLLKGKFQSLQTCIKMSICVKPIFLYRHILWCQVSKVVSVWKWNNLKTTNWHMSSVIFKAI